MSLNILIDYTPIKSVYWRPISMRPCRTLVGWSFVLRQKVGHRARRCDTAARWLMLRQTEKGLLVIERKLHIRVIVKRSLRVLSARVIPTHWLSLRETIIVGGWEIMPYNISYNLTFALWFCSAKDVTNIHFFHYLKFKSAHSKILHQSWEKKGFHFTISATG